VDEKQPEPLSLARTLSPPAPPEITSNVASLPALLADTELDTSTDQAFRALYEIWQRPSDFKDTPPCGFAVQQGLKCEFLVGSKHLIEMINRPAILSLVDQAGQLHNAVLTGMSRDTIRLRIGGEQYTVGNADLARHWYGEFLVLWQPQNGVDSLLVQNTRSENVAWLRNTLERLETGKQPNSISTYYDQALAEQVKRFQRQQKLEADGKAGVQTLIAINTALNISDIPLLINKKVVEGQ